MKLRPIPNAATPLNRRARRFSAASPASPPRRAQRSCPFQLLAYYAKACIITTNGGNSMPTRNVVLTERHETLIEALVQSGRYQNASEVLREGLRLVESREVDEAAKLGALRAAAVTGVAAFDRGDFKEFATASALTVHLNDLGDRAPSGPTDAP